MKTPTNLNGSVPRHRVLCARMMFSDNPSVSQWFFRREKKPALPWTISRREEIDSYITARSFGLYRIITLMAGEGFWYNAIKRKRMQYVVCKLVSCHVALCVPNILNPHMIYLVTLRIRTWCCLTTGRKRPEYQRKRKTRHLLVARPAKCKSHPLFCACLPKN